MPLAVRSGVQASLVKPCPASVLPAERRASVPFQACRNVRKAVAGERHVKVCATAAPPAQASPFAAVDSEAALFGILKAGQSSGKVSKILLR